MALWRDVRTILTSGVAIAVLLAALAPAEAAYQRKTVYANRAHAKKEPPKALEVPIITISLSQQRLTVYDKGEVIAHAPVSTGMAGHPTPTGIFSVIGKEVFHRSNIYSGAPMPFMQRITWSGVALHAGVLPGYPASHGCIRMPPDFAVRLYGITRKGARVLVTRGEVAPVRFTDPHLFALSRPSDSSMVKTAEARTPAVLSDAVGAPKVVAQNASKNEATEAVKDEIAKAVKDASSDAAADAAKEVVKNAIEGAVKEATSPDDTAPQGAPAVSAKPAEDAQTAVKDGVHAAAGDASKQGESQGGSAAAGIDAQGAAMATAPRKAAETSDVGSKPAPAEVAALEPYGPERPLRPGPITVFVSKKEGKVFVRKGFQPVLSAPVTIENPELPLGTHMFTAIDEKSDGVNFDWLAVSLPTSSAARAEVVRRHHGRRAEKVVAPAAVPRAASAAEALARVEIPPYALARISELMSPGASFIISDQGLGYETGLDTDFIVLTR